MEKEWRIIPSVDVTIGRNNHDGLCWSIHVDIYTDKERKYVRGIGKLIDGKFIPFHKDGKYRMVKTQDNRLMLLERKDD